MVESATVGSEPRRFPLQSCIPFVGLSAVLLWAFWSSLEEMSGRWANDPQYSHGYIVPLFACILLWFRRESFPLESIGVSLWGLPLLLAAVVFRVVSAQLYLEWFDSLSLIPMVAGLVLLCFGWRVLLWAAPAIAFLAFMIPLPYSIETAMRGPLRRLGTISSTYVMQTLGLRVYSEGNVIVMDSHSIGVAEACSGLRMLVIFFALSTAVAMISQRAWWERVLVVLSAVPIALIANITRITVTGMLFEYAGAEIAEKVFHDLAGWLMMPFGLALLGIESWILSRLFIQEDEVPLAPITGFGLPRGGRPSGGLATAGGARIKPGGGSVV
jgi:exosortase